MYLNILNFILVIKFSVATLPALPQGVDYRKLFNGPSETRFPLILLAFSLFGESFPPLRVALFQK
jgi:hypothetical protein